MPCARGTEGGCHKGMPPMLRVTGSGCVTCWRQPARSCCWRRCCWVWPDWCWTQSRRVTWSWPSGPRAAMSPSSARAYPSLRPVGLAAPRPERGQRSACRRQWCAAPKPRQCDTKFKHLPRSASFGYPGSDRRLTGNEFRRVDARCGSASARRVRDLTTEKPPLKLSGRTADVRGRQCPTHCRQSVSQTERRGAAVRSCGARA